MLVPLALTRWTTPMRISRSLHCWTRNVLVQPTRQDTLVGATASIVARTTGQEPAKEVRGALTICCRPAGILDTSVRTIETD